MTTYIAGIDPGRTGAIAMIGIADGPVVFDMPDSPADLADELESWQGAYRGFTCIVERAQAMPRQGVSSTFQTGYGYGTIIGVLAALRIPYRLVTPAVWKQAMGLSGKDKSASRALARSLYPTADLHRVRDHGRAEAILLAEWGRRQNGTKEN